MQGTDGRVGGALLVAGTMAMAVLVLLPPAGAQQTAADTDPFDATIDLCSDADTPVHEVREITVVLRSTVGSVEPGDIRIDARISDEPDLPGEFAFLLDTDHLHAEAKPLGGHDVAGTVGLHAFALDQSGPCTAGTLIVDLKPEDGVVTVGLGKLLAFTVTAGIPAEGEGPAPDADGGAANASAALTVEGAGMTAVAATLATGAFVWAGRSARRNDRSPPDRR